MSLTTVVEFNKIEGGTLRVEVGLIIQYRGTPNGTNIWTRFTSTPIEVSEPVTEVQRTIKQARDA